MAQYGHEHGGVGAPVGPTVFKTAGRSLGAVSDGFDSHTPLPILHTLTSQFVIFSRGLAELARLCVCGSKKIAVVAAKSSNTEPESQIVATEMAIEPDVALKGCGSYLFQPL
jgi:hypothetical protein